MRVGKSLWVGPSDAPVPNARWIIPLLWLGWVAIMVVALFLWNLLTDSDGRRYPPSPDPDRLIQAQDYSRGNARTLPPAPRLTPNSAGREEPERGGREPDPPQDAAPLSPPLPDLLLFIRSQESGGNYTEVNPGGCEGYGCYGAYQLHGRYMGDWATRYGHPEVAGIPATQWPRATQDEVALGLFNDTSGGAWCDWTDYC